MINVSSNFTPELDPDLYTAPELEHHSLLSCEKEFKHKGGKLFVFQKQDDRVNGCFTLCSETDVYPICSAGNCRSQVLYHILFHLVKNGGFRLHPPHAARTGYDPYHGTVPIEFYDQIQDEFFQTFGHPKVKQFGFNHVQQQIDQFGCDINSPSFVKALRDFYDHHLYAPKGLPSRVYIAFMRPVHAVLKRLIESNHDLTSVTLVTIPLDDEITNVPKQFSFKMRSMEAYKNFEAKLIPLFKCSLSCYDSTYTS
jgi:hypothetical protein